LNVYIKQISYGMVQTSERLVWSINQNQGDKWYIARIPTDYDLNYQIIFEGIVGSSPLGDVVF
jgi:hypothetical protein